MKANWDLTKHEAQELFRFHRTHKATESPDMTNTKPDAPLTVGEIVGHAGKRAEIAFIPASFKHYKLFIRYTDGSGSAFVWATDLTAPPPIADHVQQAARQLVAEGWLTDPWGAIFGRDES